MQAVTIHPSLNVFQQATIGFHRGVHVVGFEHPRQTLPKYQKKKDNTHNDQKITRVSRFTVGASFTHPYLYLQHTSEFPTKNAIE